MTDLAESVSAELDRSTTILSKAELFARVGGEFFVLLHNTNWPARS
jgi:hypothetical protein